MSAVRNFGQDQSRAHVAMPDGSTHGLTTLLSHANHKQAKGAGFLSVGLTLTPRATGRAGRTLCSFATQGCAVACFADHDRLAWPQNKRVAVARTRLLAQAPATFFAMLVAELTRAKVRAERLGVKLVCRLNVVSDVAFEREFPDLFIHFTDVQFMDYTKDIRRMLNPQRPRNYHLTFSRSERNEAECLRVLEAGHNVAVVFRCPPFPRLYWGYPVIDGDAHDFRFLDAGPGIIGLKAKGKGARTDQTGFVLDTVPLARPPVVSRSKVGGLPEGTSTTSLQATAKRRSV